MKAELTHLQLLLDVGAVHLAVVPLPHVGVEPIEGSTPHTHCPLSGQQLGLSSPWQVSPPLPLSQRLPRRRSTLIGREAVNVFCCSADPVLVRPSLRTIL